ncbi:GNAT family N-acetyltransferase [Pseudomonas sp. N040]|uniref:GNAT family N-acetyltransferase n=1 Tax=Pseudomonas sp. N040 TaxID=2785325 RepID=UPI0018A30FD9|nr:GNAT family N-acetyltransferase [Pseudomonas sp. N040]MBF7730964.1 GNAT family N-acetyltransferase [Pseudomonas sp. N040]MBW7014607.1 GNAT family N-acetyltransferase [Pseudomonas sp. N040]
MPLKFRPAESRDAEQAVPLIYSSGAAAFDYVFKRAGLSAEDFLRAAFVDGSGMFGYPRHWVGELGGRVVATGTGYSGELNLRNMLSATRQILLCYGPVSALPVMLNGLRLERIIQPPPRQTYYLAHLGVAEDLRSQGIGTRLVEHLLKLGRAAGFTQAALDVAASNPQAQELYERLGFAVVAERVSSLDGIANHRYMTRAL